VCVCVFLFFFVCVGGLFLVFNGVRADVWLWCLECVCVFVCVCVCVCVS